MADFSRSFGSLPNVRMKNKTSECIKFGCERSDAIYEHSDTNREQWFRIRIPKSELSIEYGKPTVAKFNL